MLYDPTNHYQVHLQDEELQLAHLELMARAGMGSHLAAGAPSIIALEYLRREIAKLELPSKIRAIYNRLRQQLLQSDPEPTKAHNNIAHRYGIELQLGDDAYKAMLDEVRRFKWIEAERAGRDIWKERNPHDPEAVAFQEWFTRYFGAWYLSRHRRHHPAPT